MRLLYVDDDRINTLLFAEACRSLPGLEVEVAASGAEAVEVAAAWRPDLLVLDLHLPDTDGLALAATLRRPGAACAAAEAVLCTADDDPAVRAAAVDAGFAACWDKPVDRSALPGLIAALSRGSVR
jgi:CheY-like chemotaxis protein